MGGNRAYPRKWRRLSNCAARPDLNPMAVRVPRLRRQRAPKSGVRRRRFDAAEEGWRGGAGEIAEKGREKENPGIPFLLLLI